MPQIDVEAATEYRDARFAANEAFRSESAKAVLACFDPGQFIPVHAPDSDVIVNVRAGHGTVREGGTAHAVGPGDVVAIEAATRRGIHADEGERLEALLVTAPPPTDAEHGPVRRGLQNGTFEPPLDGDAEPSESEGSR